VNHTNDVFWIVLIDWQTGMRGIQTLFKDRIRRISKVHHFDVRAMQHDLFNHTFAKIKRSQNTVTIFLVYDPLRVPQLQRTGNFFVYRQNMAVRINSNAEHPQNTAHKVSNRGNDW
jgi:hypothetical protein